MTLDIPGVFCTKVTATRFFSVNAYSVPRLPTPSMAGWLSADSPSLSLDANQGVSYNPADVEQLITFPTRVARHNLRGADLRPGG